MKKLAGALDAALIQILYLHATALFYVGPVASFFRCALGPVSSVFFLLCPLICLKLAINYTAAIKMCGTANSNRKYVAILFYYSINIVESTIVPVP